MREKNLRNLFEFFSFGFKWFNFFLCRNEVESFFSLTPISISNDPENPFLFLFSLNLSYAFFFPFVEFPRLLLLPLDWVFGLDFLFLLFFWVCKFYWIFVSWHFSIWFQLWVCFGLIDSVSIVLILHWFSNSINYYNLWVFYMIANRMLCWGYYYFRFCGHFILIEQQILF